MAEAYVVDAGRADTQSLGRMYKFHGRDTETSIICTSSHLAHHHEHAVRYLENRKGERAFFAICMSGYEGTLAESVTSIALHLMR